MSDESTQGEVTTPPPRSSFAAGRYRVLRALGAGGQKAVYLVHDETLDRDCALSLILADRMRPDEVKQLRREARALARMGAHPQVVTVYDLGDEEGMPYIVCEYMPGGDLAGEITRTEGPLPVERAVSVGRDLLRALAAVHGQGIVHRDIKPENVFLSADGAPKIGDFGLALASGRTQVTADNLIAGTPGYMPPEQLQGETLDARTDLYAVGCVLYEMLTGRSIFEGPMLAVISQHLHATPTPPQKHNLDVPDALGALVLSLVAKRPGDRPATALEALRRLDEATNSPPSQVASMTPAAHVDAGDEDIASQPTLDVVPLVKVRSVPPPPASRSPDATAPPPPREPSVPAPRQVTQPAPRNAPARDRGPSWGVYVAAVLLAAALGAVVAARSSMTRTAAPARAAVPRGPRRLAVVPVGEPGAQVDDALAWSLASRVVEEVDHYGEFRTVSPAGMLGARLAVGARALPDELRAVEMARHVRADTVAALAVGGAAGGVISIALHVFAVADPSEGVTGMRMRLSRADLDADGPSRIAERIAQALGRQWSLPRLTDQSSGAAGQGVPFAAWQLYQEGVQFCAVGRWTQCQDRTRRALALAPDDPVLLSQMSCALSYGEGSADEAAEIGRRLTAALPNVRSNRERLLLRQGELWSQAEQLHERGDRERARAVGRQVVEINMQVAEGHSDPWGLLYAAAATQYFLGDVPRARALYDQVKRLVPSAYPPYFEEAKLLRGDGSWAQGNREAARVLWTFITCFPEAELNGVAREDAERWRLPRPTDPLSCPSR